MGLQEPREPSAADESDAGGGADLGAIVSAVALMWVVLRESSGFLQLLVVAIGVSAFAMTRLRIPLPPLRRGPLR